MNDTIFALATAKGRSGVAVVRVSGPNAFFCASALAGRGLVPRKPSLRRLRGTSGIEIDQGLVLLFGSGSSFTGEDVVEFQCHGSAAVIDALLKELGGFAGSRLAEPGEFTRRAMENGCLDLSQVEGLADLLEAETEAQRVQAYRTLQGELSTKVDRWRTDLVRAAALVEATIDFADEDIPVDVMPEVSALMTGVLHDLESEVAGSYVAERIRDGFEVAIVGPPNAGKSTLLNAIAGRDAAITSEFAGTTRDVIEVKLDLEGLAVTLLDTAGLRESTDLVESLGIERAIQRAKSADLRVFLLGSDGSLPLEPLEDDIVLDGKSDLKTDQPKDGISGVTGFGVDSLMKRVARILSKRSALAQSAVRLRHREAILVTRDQLTSAIERASSGVEESEFLAMELNTAARSLSSLIGRVGVEDLLDEIFASFCLGK